MPTTEPLTGQCSFAYIAVTHIPKVHSVCFSQLCLGFPNGAFKCNFITKHLICM